MKKGKKQNKLVSLISRTALALKTGVAVARSTSMRYS
jgi:hypothetical protein